MMRTFLIFFVLSLRCFSQSGKIDSLMKIARKGNEKESIDALNGLAFELRNKDPDTAFYYASLALQFSEAVQYELGEAESNLATGMTHLVVGDITESEKILVFPLN